MSAVAPSPERGASATPISAPDLAELFASFSEATRGLERTHEALRAEVARLQAELRGANEQLERSRALAALGEMAAGIAHEVRNPLAAVALRARLLEADLEHDPALRASAAAIAAAVRVADSVVTDVLTFSRQAPLRLARIAARECLTAAAEACAPVFAARPSLSLVIAPEADDRDPIMITCDVALIRQALVNLIRNAAEATDEARPGAPRRISLEAARRDALDPSGARRAMIALAVRDTGPGIAEDVADRVFNPFFTTRDTGTGLGLAIVHRIADAHCGLVSALNARDLPRASPGAQGAIFELLLPEPPDDRADAPGRRAAAHTPARSAEPPASALREHPKDAAS